MHKASQEPVPGTCGFHLRMAQDSVGLGQPGLACTPTRHFPLAGSCPCSEEPELGTQVCSLFSKQILLATHTQFSAERVETGVYSWWH